MSGEKIFLLSLCIIFALGQNCPSYTCGTLAPGTCVSYAASVYTVYPCTAGSATPYCPPIDAVNNPAVTTSTCIASPNTASLAYPGISCSSGTACYSGICTKGYCVGASSGAACSKPALYSQNVMCAQGLYCNLDATPSVCAPLKEKYSGCNSDYECKYGTGCYSGICVEYGEIDNGDQMVASFCFSGNSPFCEDGQCYTFTNGTAICISPLESSAKTPTKCTSDSGCLSKVNKEIGFAVTGTCMCGYNPTGTAYCNTFDGESYGEKLFSLLEDWDDSDEIENCNIDVAYSYDCMASRWSKTKAAEMAYYSYMAKNQFAVYQTYTCVRSVYLTNFIYYSGLYNDTSSFATGLVASLIGLTLLA